ncbi:hypothetical protein ACFQ6B_31880 [Streptomyces wedmorensis]|uniref:Uncharacterized protein n=1 Tax=Streptomyces wedmorensis TaxID=43759 RepID=A0ABW6IPM4_STRWE
MAETDVPTLIADLKITVIQGHIRQILEHAAVMRELSSNFAHLKEKINEIHVEVVKDKGTEMLEMLGLDSIAAIHEKYKEAQVDPEVAWKDWLISGAVGILVATLVPAVIFLLRGKIVDLWRHAWTKGDKEKTVPTSDGNGWFRKEKLGDIQKREERKWQGAGGIADIPAGANFDALRGQLTSLNPELEKFNSHAPDFKRNLRGMPSLTKATKIADAVKKLGEAIDPTQTPLIAKALGKINEGVTYSDPKKTTAFAKAIGKLKVAMNNFDPSTVPTAAALGPAAQKAGELAQHTTTLTRHMRGFADAVRELNSQMNPA